MQASKDNKQRKKLDSMKFYDVDSVFTFGKHEGLTIAEVYQKDPKYIDFCFENIDEFYVAPDVMKELKIIENEQQSQEFNRLGDDEIDMMFDEMREIGAWDEDKIEEEFSWDDEDDLADDSYEDPYDEDEDMYDDFDDDDF